MGIFYPIHPVFSIGNSLFLPMAGAASKMFFDSEKTVEMEGSFLYHYTVSI
jgi:hypothetical protein